MKLKVLGCDGGVAEGSTPPSYLFGENLAFDAGVLAACLNVEAQDRIEAIIVSHHHHDHVLSLPFLCDNRVGRGIPPLVVYGLAETLEALRTHVFNDVIWPDFTRIPNPENPTLTFRELRFDQSLEFPSVRITPFSMNHTVPCAGLSIEAAQAAFVLGADSRSLDPVIEQVHRARHRGLRVQGAIAEASFPNHMKSLAQDTGHMTPNDLRPGLIDSLADVPLWVNHVKPDVRDEVFRDLRQLAIDLETESSLSIDRSDQAKFLSSAREPESRHRLMVRVRRSHRLSNRDLG